jgi:hypothetical protein
MFRYPLLAVVLCVFGVFVFTFLAQRAVCEVKGSDPLAIQVKQLQDTVKKLEMRIAALEKRPVYVTVPEVHSVRPSGPAVPKEWREQEFNGMKYYIVPLERK